MAWRSSSLIGSFFSFFVAPKFGKTHMLVYVS